MIPSEYYHLFYILLVSFLSIIAFYKYSRVTADEYLETSSNTVVIELIIVIFMILFVGFRDPYYRDFGDTAAYTLFFERRFGETFTWNWDVQSILFDNIYSYFGCNFKDVSIFYLSISTIYFGGIWYACRKIFPRHSFAALLVYLAAFSTFSYSTNGIKAGAASSLFLVALAINDKGSMPKVFSYIFLILSLGFHHSMLVPVLAFLICKIIKNPRFYTALWIVSFFIAAFHISYFQDFFASIGSDKAESYLNSELEIVSKLGLSGFRIDFILYSVIPIIVGWVAVYGRKIDSPKYLFLLNLYTLVNAIWILCIYAVFTNRIAYLSWLMYPFVLIYPFLKEDWGDDRYKVFKYVAYGHLVFTLFMNFIY